MLRIVLVAPTPRISAVKRGLSSFVAFRSSSLRLTHYHLHLLSQDIIHRDDVIFYDLVKRCLCIDPRRRITAREAMNHNFFTAIRGFRKPTEPLFRVPAAKQARLDMEDIEALSLGVSTATVAAQKAAAAAGDGGKRG